MMQGKAVDILVYGTTAGYGTVVLGQWAAQAVVAGAVSPMRRELQEQPNGSKERGAVDQRH
jgi:hypothetical protein